MHQHENKCLAATEVVMDQSARFWDKIAGMAGSPYPSSIISERLLRDT